MKNKTKNTMQYETFISTWSEKGWIERKKKKKEWRNCRKIYESINKGFVTETKSEKCMSRREGDEYIAFLLNMKYIYINKTQTIFSLSKGEMGKKQDWTYEECHKKLPLDETKFKRKSMTKAWKTIIIIMKK